MKNVYAVVVTYNRRQLLEECLQSIMNQSTAPDKIVVLDNHSTDGTQRLFIDGGVFDHERFIYRRMEKNLGGAGGFHEGIKIAYQQGADWIWIMDDDTIPDPNALNGFKEALDVVGEQVSFLASSVYGPGQEAMNVPKISMKKSKTDYPDWYCYLDKGLVGIEAATFVSLLINSEAVRKTGLPVTDYFIWGDDYEYTLRLTNYFAKAYMCGHSTVTHKRAICKRISIENENDPGRLGNFYYNYRNNLITVKEYKGVRFVIQNILAWNTLCLKILFDKRQKYRLKKAGIIQKGIFGYLFKRYDVSQFKNRFTNDM